MEKSYLALVDGKPPTPSGRVEAHIGRDPSHRKRMAIVPESRGREAISEYKTLESFKSHTLLEFHPLTGRTHQIRLHCAFLGCPIVADEVYGRKKPSITIDSHVTLNLGASQYLPLTKDQKLLAEVGLTGYSQWKITGDTGDDTRNGSVLDRVHAVGAQLGVIYVPLNLSVIARYDREYASEARFQGEVFSLGVGLKL